jgi:hypothetical protein
MTAYGTEDKGARTVVARFNNMESARQALDELGGKESGVKSGSVLLRDQSGSVYVRDLDESSLGEIARNGIDLGTFVIVGGLGILVEATLASANLLLRSGGRALNLAGSVVKAPVRGVRDFFLSDPTIEDVSESLLPGASAIIVDVEAGKSVDVAARLRAAGAVDVTTE